MAAEEVADGEQAAVAVGADSEAVAEEDRREVDLEAWAEAAASAGRQAAAASEAAAAAAALAAAVVDEARHTRLLVCKTLCTHHH